MNILIPPIVNMPRVFRHIYHELTQLYEQGHCDSFGNSLHRVAMLLLFMILIGDKNVLLFNE